MEKLKFTSILASCIYFLTATAHSEPAVSSSFNFFETYRKHGHHYHLLSLDIKGSGSVVAKIFEQKHPKTMPGRVFTIAYYKGEVILSSVKESPGKFEAYLIARTKDDEVIFGKFSVQTINAKRIYKFKGFITEHSLLYRKRASLNLKEIRG